MAMKKMEPGGAHVEQVAFPVFAGQPGEKNFEERNSIVVVDPGRPSFLVAADTVVRKSFDELDEVHVGDFDKPYFSMAADTVVHEGYDGQHK